MKLQLVFLLVFGILSVASFGENAVSGKNEDPAPKKATVITDSSQQIADVIVNSKIPVLVDFWAAWCGPCKLLNPIIKQLEKDYDKRVLFLKVNVDVHRSISAYFSVNAIPAVFIIKDKTVVKMIPGLQPKETYAQALNDVLGIEQNTSSKPAE